jgi:Fic family protein
MHTPLPMRWNPEKPYDSLPELPPSVEIESRRVLKQCVTSRAALAELNVAANLIPNPSILINLSMLEAQASSEIENIVTTADALFQSMHANERADPATREALRYRTALLEGVSSLKARPLSTNTIEAICTTVKGVEMTVRRVPGVQPRNTTTGAVIYTPPEGEARLRQLLKNWEDFLHSDAAQTPFDPLVRMAVLHYQFEAIHPFTDGNGRTGRVLNSLFLVDQDLLSQPILYLSRYIIAHKADYYRLLEHVTRGGDWEEWLLFILRGIEDTARWTVAKIEAMRTLTGDLTAFLREHYPKLYSRELVDILFEQPYCRIAHLVERGLGTRQLASRYLHALVEAGVLHEVRKGQEKLFLHSQLLELLTRESNAVKPYGVR